MDAVSLVPDSDDPETWLVTYDEEGWQVKERNTDEATSCHETKAEAVEAAEALARERSQGGIHVRRRDGTLQRSVSFEADDDRAPA